MSDRDEAYGGDNLQRRQNSLKSSAMHNISDRNRFDTQPYSNSSYMSETAFSQSSSKRANSIAYGPDGLAFGIIPKEIIEKIENSREDWMDKNEAFEAIYGIINETSSITTLTPYVPSFLKYH